MPTSRYNRSARLRGGNVISSSEVNTRLRKATESGALSTFTHVVKESERLDILAGRFLGTSQYWWVIAACSGIGWALQVPPGTRLRIPRDVAKMIEMVG
jgi:hypothetical protein